MRAVVPVAVAGLPRVSARAAAASRQVARWIGVDDRTLTLAVAGAGAVQVRLDGFEATELRGAEVVSLVGSDGRRAQVFIDGRMALHLVSAALGRGTPRVHRRLGFGERGVLAAQVLAVAAQVGREVSVSLDTPRTPDPGKASDPMVALSLRVDALGTMGRVRLEMPAVWLAGSRGRGHREDGAFRRGAARLITSAVVELAITEIPAASWAGATSGDAVVFDGAAMSGAAEIWQARVRIGDHVAAATVDAAGSLTLTSQFLSEVPRSSRPIGKREARIIMSSQPQTTEGENAAVLAAAPVEVIAVLARLTLRGDEVLGLARGSVLTLGTRSLSVVLTAGGEAWARGDLVDVDGELGVRITELPVRGRP